ncbi:MAG: Mannonate dehydratase [uncultured Chloroflexi bacterium]|uniref:mannonate dehydratase n=1 Tax=uncultured Chloroflexota bacterium TaxID=166587 RepID=A0A6J4H905_9CHLR|nr:MAG: Mannonate dehydratase [uncultured Chloroflexota bacterium]
MYLGHQTHSLSDEKLQWIAQLGVEHVACENRQGIEREDGTWDVQGIRDAQARLKNWGITMDVLALALPSVIPTRQRFPEIILGTPGRDKAIETIQQNIRTAGEAGVPALKYNLNLMGVARTQRSKGRGGAMYSHFNYDEWPSHDAPEWGPMPAEKVWDNISYFLEKVVPVAEEAKVKLACHPHDPGIKEGIPLSEQYCVLGSVNGLKKFISMFESPYHCLNFCQGTITEMLEDPAAEIHDVIRYFGERQKIVMVHFRNIKGKVHNFEEVYPDNGDVDMLKAARTYKEAGFPGMLCPDHVPQSAVDQGGDKQFSFCLGYIAAAIQAANAS